MCIRSSSSRTSPGATYEVYFGLFSGDKRLAVKHGKHSDNRIMGGPLVIH